MSDSAGLVWRGADIAIGKGVLDAESKLGWVGGSAFSKATGFMGAVVDGIMVVESAMKNDGESAFLYAGQGTGMLMATLAAGGPIGWIGLGLMVGSAVGLWAWNEHKANSTHEPRWDDGRSMKFLQQSGINEGAARTLSDQSGDGHSVVPLLARYARTQGIDMGQADQQKKFVDWINGMDSGDLETLKNRLQDTADKLEGDAGKFDATAANDGSYESSVTEYYDQVYTMPTGEVTSYSAYGASPVGMTMHPAPMSAAQLEKVLQELGVPAL